MASSSFGNIFKITTWGESHGKALGVVIDGCPAGLALTEQDIQKYLNRRKPGTSSITTPRKEADEVEILSGTFEGRTTGTPISLMVRNTSQISKDYSEIASYYRPGHADYTFDQKYGFRDYRGGGRSSGRETAARVAAGAIATEILKKSGIKITAYTIKAAGIEAKERDFSQIEKNLLRCPDATAAEKMLAISYIASHFLFASAKYLFTQNCKAPSGVEIFDGFSQSELKQDADLARRDLAKDAKIARRRAYAFDSLRL